MTRSFLCVAIYVIAELALLGCVTVPKAKSVTNIMREKQKNKFADARETMYGTDAAGYSDTRRRIATGARK